MLNEGGRNLARVVLDLLGLRLRAPLGLLPSEDLLHRERQTHVDARVAAGQVDSHLDLGRRWRRRLRGLARCPGRRLARCPPLGGRCGQRHERLVPLGSDGPGAND